MRIGLQPEDYEFKIQSFCTVTTKEVVKETLFLIKTIRLLYSKTPICIACGDQYSMDLLAGHGLELQPFSSIVNLNKVIKRNDYHRIDAIYQKMQIFQDAIYKHGSSVFLDSDIFLLQPLNGPEDCRVALSLNLTHSFDVVDAISDAGMFNAGMVYSNSLDFVDWWREKFLYQGSQGFYEQRCLNLVMRDFRINYFNVKHNFGFWRGGLGNFNPFSLHCHMDFQLDSKMPMWMLSQVKKLRNDIIQYLEKKYPHIHQILIETIYNENSNVMSMPTDGCLLVR